MLAAVSFIILAILPFHNVFATAAPGDARAILAVSESQWQALNKSVQGRLHLGYPLAKPCYSVYNGQAQSPDVAQCSAVQQGYTDELYIASQFPGYMNTNWGFCQSNGSLCGLDFDLPSDPTYYAPPNDCYQGSVPSYYIDVAEPSDVQAGLAFAQSHGLPLVTKNSGHDYKGRSSAPGALALWTTNVTPAITLQENFQPEGCAAPSGKTAVTLGAGQDFVGVYEFGEAHNVTVVGGSSRSVGIGGGWIAGGGHGALSNTFGLGVDNVLQIKAILPNGTQVTANACQNQDLYFALRGGGGNTFGINWEMTTTAHPQVTLQVTYIRLVSLNLEDIHQLISICVKNANKWAGEGWGGYISLGAATNRVSGLILMTPVLTHAEAVKSMKPLTSYAASLGTVPLNNEVETSPSFYQAYQKYILPNEEKVGVGVAVGSRLLPTDLFTTSSQQKKTIAALQKVAKLAILDPVDVQETAALTYSGPFQILMTAPSSFSAASDAVPASITPAWRTAVWHLVVGQGIANNADTTAINKAFKTSHDAAQILRDLAPTSGAYQNEADVFESDPNQAFWGESNYRKLLTIKKSVDPHNLLTCWDCIGWDSSDARYKCYPAAPS